MNVYAAIIVVALLADALLNFVADLLNLRHLSKRVPAEFKDCYDEASYARAQEYLKATTRFDWLSSAYGLLLLFLFWGFGGFAALHHWLDGPDKSPVAVGLLYIGILLLGRSLLFLPFRIYSTFVIEQRFGFNRTTAATFVGDRVKVLLVATVIGGPLLALILYLFARAGDSAWLYGWLATAAIMMTVQFVAPRWILPLFNRFKPLEDESLKREIASLAERARFPLREVMVVDGSRRSSKANAFFTGFGRNRRIALFDTLLENHEQDEVVAVLAHEIGHFRKRHISQNLFLAVAHAGVLFFLLSIFLGHRGLYEAFHLTGAQPVYAGLVFFSLLYHPIEMGLGLLLNAWSRRHEYQADDFAGELMGSGRALARALKKLSRDSLVNLTPHPFYVKLNYSHPPILERVRRLDGARNHNMP